MPRLIPLVILLFIPIFPLYIFASPPDRFGKEPTSMDGYIPDDMVAQPIQTNSSIGAEQMGMQAPVFGHHYVVVILVQYGDMAGSTQPTDWESLWFNPSDSVKEYYLHNSRGSFSVQPASEEYGVANDGIIGWVDTASDFWGNTNHPFPAGDQKREEDVVTRHEMAYNAIKAADPYINFAKYDTNNDGHIAVNELHIAIVSAGFDRAGANNVPNVMAHRGSFRRVPEQTIPVYHTDDGVLVGDKTKNGGYSLVGELHYDGTPYMATLGPVCHEFAHDIGVPDMYDLLNQDRKGIGDFGLMSSGVWNRESFSDKAGSKPANLCAWNRIYLGWEQVKTLDSPQAAGHYEIKAVTSTLYSEAYYDVRWGDYGEHFLLEVRKQEGYDAGLPGEGMVIYRVDEEHIAAHADLNEIQSHGKYGVAVVEADGGNQLGGGIDEGTAGDMFSLATTFNFNADSNPASVDYEGNSTGIAVTDISAPSQRMSFNFTCSNDAPTAPKNVTATKGERDYIYVSWTGVTNAEAYAVFRAKTDDNWEYFKLLDATVTNTGYEDHIDCVGVSTEGTLVGKFMYRVSAKVNGLWSSPSSLSEDSVGWVMQGPSTVTPSRGIFSDKIALIWQAVPEATLYYILRDTTAESASPSTIGNTTGSFYIDTDASLTPGTDYYYWVLPIQATTQGCYMTPSFPRAGSISSGSVAPIYGVVASDGAYRDKIQVSWVAQPGIQSYKVYRDTSSVGTFSDLRTPSPITTSIFEDTDVAADTVYYYKVEGIDIDSVSVGLSSDMDAGLAQSVVTGVQASDGEPDAITLQWEAFSGAQSYAVYRGETSSHRPVFIGTTADTSFPDQTASPIITYSYWIVADLGDRFTPFSDPDTGYLPLPAPGAGQVFQGANRGELRITWEPVQDAELYFILRSQTSDGTFTEIATTSETNYMDTGLEDFTTYYYKIQTQSQGLISIASDPFFGVTLPTGTPPEITVLYNPTDESYYGTWEPIVPLVVVFETGDQPFQWEGITVEILALDTDPLGINRLELFWDVDDNHVFEPNAGDVLLGAMDNPELNTPLNITLDSVQQIEMQKELHIGVKLFPSFPALVQNTAPDHTITVASVFVWILPLVFLLLLVFGWMCVRRPTRRYPWIILLSIVLFTYGTFISCNDMALPIYDTSQQTIHSYQVSIPAGGIHGKLDTTPYPHLPAEQIQSGFIRVLFQE